MASRRLRRVIAFLIYQALSGFTLASVDFFFAVRWGLPDGEHRLRFFFARLVFGVGNFTEITHARLLRRHCQHEHQSPVGMSFRYRFSVERRFSSEAVS